VRCLECQGPYHPSSGHLYPEWDVAFCGACYKPFLRWLTGHMKRQWSGHEFYAEAATSVIPGRTLPAGEFFLYPHPRQQFRRRKKP
jgi:hypothetical protein